MVLELEPGFGAVGNARLVRAIVDEMAGGAIPFERFMELALYHPEHGYYRKAGRIGTGGDFLTSPAVHPMFGWVVGAWCRDAWEQLGKPAEFTVIEPGAGEGRLAAAVLDWAEGRDDGFREALRYVAIEPNSPGNEGRVTWSAGPVAPVACGVVVANELFDAFPVRLVDVTERGPMEVLVRWEGDHFEEIHGGLMTIDDAPERGRFEVNQHAYPAMRSLCSLVERGAVLVLDYGYPQEELWAPWRTAGTLLCFYRHTAHEDPYIHVGEQDMTAHVNFSDLVAAAEDEGMEVRGPVSQGAFLAAAGIHGLVESARGDLSEYFARRRAVETLTDGAGLGRVRVLAATRGLSGPLPGFEDAG